MRKAGIPNYLDFLSSSACMCKPFLDTGTVAAAIKLLVTGMAGSSPQDTRHSVFCIPRTRTAQYPIQYTVSDRMGMGTD